MKCIFEFGNFFFSNLETGEVKTISPIEEKRIINIFNILSIIKNSNIFYFFLLLALSYSNDLKSYVNLDSIIHQKKRIEFEVEFLNRNYWIESNIKEILLIRDYETGKDIKWDFTIFNKNLQNHFKMEIEIDRSYTLLKKKSENNNFNILFKKEYSNEKEYMLIKINSDSSKILKYEIKLPINSKIIDFITYDNLIIFSSSNKKKENLLNIYNIRNKRFINLYASLKINEKVISIKKINETIFEIIVLSEDLDKSNFLSKRIFDLNGNEINRIQVSIKNRSLISGNFYTINSNKIIGVGLYGKKNSNDAIGIYISSFFDNKLEYLKKYNFFQLPNFYKNDEKYLKKNILKKIEKKDFDKIKLDDNFFPNELIKIDNNLVFSAESILLNYNNNNNYTYIPYYNTYAGTYDKMINPNFKGYDHTKFLITSFNLNGEVNWNESFKINDLNTFEEAPYFKSLFYKNNILTFYINNGFFKYILINEKNEIKTIPIITKYKDDKIKETETNPEATKLWYNNNYYTYGIQKIKNTVKGDLKVNRRVFFICNFEIVK